MLLLLLLLKGPTAIRNVYNWRVKETERMVAIVTELTKLGAKVRSVSPPPPPHAVHGSAVSGFSHCPPPVVSEPLYLPRTTPLLAVQSGRLPALSRPSPMGYSTLLCPPPSCPTTG